MFQNGVRERARNDGVLGLFCAHCLGKGKGASRSLLKKKTTDQQKHSDKTSTSLSRSTAPNHVVTAHSRPPMTTSSPVTTPSCSVTTTSRSVTTPSRTVTTPSRPAVTTPTISHPNLSVGASHQETSSSKPF